MAEETVTAEVESAAGEGAKSAGDILKEGVSIPKHGRSRTVDGDHARTCHGIWY